MMISAAPSPVSRDLGAADPAIAASSPVTLDGAQALRRIPLGPDLERAPRFYETFDDSVVFHDVFRDHTGAHVYLVGPMALNLEPVIDAMTLTGLPSGTPARPRIHHGVQAVIARARVPAGDTHLRIALGGQRSETVIQPNRSDAFAGDRMVFTINKDGDLDWIADWARFYVREHGASAVAIYENGSTLYDRAELAAKLEAVEGLKRHLVIPWPYRFGSMDDVFTGHRFGGNWAMFAQPPMFTQFLRKYAMRARSILNVDVDELVLSPFRRSIFGAVERHPFGLLRFNRLWVLNSREEEGPPRHSQFVVRARGRASKDRGKKWALDPRRQWMASWRAQPWTHQVKGWLNLAGSTADFYGYHFIGISRSWYWDRTERIAFDAKRHIKDRLLIDAFADHFGTPRKR